jgi:hypothetical protein
MIVSYLAYVQPNGLISHICTTPSNPPENGSMFEDLTIRYIYQANEADIGFISPGQFIEQYWWKNGGWATKATPPADATYYKWNLDTESWVLDTDLVMYFVRVQRNTKLSLCDWTQLPDAPLSEEQKAQWKTYRQALRNVPQEQPNVQTPEEVIWPEEPSTS